MTDKYLPFPSDMTNGTKDLYNTVFSLRFHSTCSFQSITTAFRIYSTVIREKYSISSTE